MSCKSWHRLPEQPSRPAMRYALPEPQPASFESVT